MLYDSASTFIAKHTLLTAGQSLVVGVSGGADSIAMLHLLTRLQPAYNLNLTVAHLNHGLRPQANSDAQFVQTVAQGWNIPCVVQRVDVKALAQNDGLSIEEAGRLARYRFFASLGSTVAVAHHADDQAETVLMHFLRGSGLAGLRGMLPLSQQTQPNEKSLTVIRPLLEITRAQIEDYVAQHQLPFVVDASNADPTFFRNRLRHELLPVLQTYNPNIRQVLNRTAQVAAGDYALLQDLTAVAWAETVLETQSDSVHFDLTHWRDLPLGLRRALLRQAVTTIRPDLRNLDFVPLESGLDWAQTAQSGLHADLLGGLELAVVGDELRLQAKSAQSAPPPDPVPLAVPGLTQFGNFQFDSALVPDQSLDQIRALANPWTAFLNPALAPFTIRARRPGDRFTPLGMSGSLKLSDFMVNRKLPVDQRDTWPLICYGPTADSIAWVCGHALADPAKLTEPGPALKIVAQPIL